MMQDDMILAMSIATRCKEEGSRAKISGAPVTACPYNEELERSSWVFGWLKARFVEIT
jgi:ribosome modulation factor